MLERLERPLTPPERDELTKMLEESPRVVTRSKSVRDVAVCGAALLISVAVFVGAIALGVSQGGLLLPILSAVGSLAFVAGIVSLYGVIAVVSAHFHWSPHVRRFERETAPEIKADLADGTAEVCRVSSDHAVVIEEFEDEESAYIFALGDGTSLYLRGAEYCPEDASAPWPARQFEIVRTKSHGIWVGLFGAKEITPVVKTVPMNELPKSFVWGSQPETESVIPGSPDEILNSLRAGGSSSSNR